MENDIDSLIQSWMKDFDSIYAKQENNWEERIRMIDYEGKKVTCEDFLKAKLKYNI